MSDVKYYIIFIFIILHSVAISYGANEKPCYTFAEIDSLISAGRTMSFNKVCISNITFGFNMSTLDPTFQKKLDELVFWFNKHPHHIIVINAHTDSIGSNDYNMVLSQQRAETVYNYLIRKGVAKKRLSFNYYGKSIPIDTNETEEGRANNRRVEFEITVDVNKNAISSGYFTLNNSDYQIGRLPSPTVSQSLGSLKINKTAIPGGSSYLDLTTTEKIEEFYVAVDGVNGYFVVPAEYSGDNTYNLLLFISQYLESSFNFVISGKNSNGDILAPLSEKVEYVDVSSGALQVSLSFNSAIDLDLHVIQPDGVRIFYRNKGGDDWGLDLDSNADCLIDGVNNENIFFPSAHILEGKYVVLVHLYLNCNYSAANWVVFATHNGVPIIPTSGKNPAMGSFSANDPGNTADLSKAVRVMEFYIGENK